MGVLSAVLVLAVVIGMVNSYNFLIVSTFSSKSHKSIFNAVAQGLVQKGHQVTLLSAQKDSRKQKGVYDVWVQQAYEIIYETSNFSFFHGSLNTPSMMKGLLDMLCQIRNVTYELPEIQELLKKSSPNSAPAYDLLIVDAVFNEFILPVAYHLRIPTIYLSPSCMHSTTAWSLNIPYPAYLPYCWSDAVKPTTLISRTINAFQNLAFIMAWQWYLFPKHDEYIQTVLPGTPPLIELERNVSFVMTHTNPSLFPSSPSMPYSIEIACLHCRPAKALPKHLEEFVNNSGEHGVIFFSIGSVTKGMQMPENIKNKLIQAFAKLPQKVLWKYEKAIQGLPANIKLTSWAPQQDLLGHPKLRLFITHCGGGSIWEASYHGVPILGIPLSADQYGNAAHAQNAGFAELLDWQTFTVGEVLDKIQLLLNNSKYKTNVMSVSSLLKDQLVSPVDKVVYWMEYVIRYNGAPHLKSAAGQLNVFQYFLLDLIVVVILGLVVVIGLIYFIIRGCLRVVCRGSSKQKKVKRN